MPELNLNRAIARNIVTKAIAVDTEFSQPQINEALRIADLDLDALATERIYKQIVRDIESVGFHTKVSMSVLSDAVTVGDVIDVVVALTTSGGPE